ncbi:MAG: DUF47 domain-containing protein [Clostridiales bacterium]|nr:DUF47 domain-containing protein [Clostridiales bacterium]
MAGLTKKDNVFYTLLSEQMGKVLTAAEAFENLVKEYDDVEEKIRTMKTLETECDLQSHKVIKQLNNSKRTPFDRGDIFAVTREIDDIVDSLEEIANRFSVFNVKEMRPEVINMTEMITKAVSELNILFMHLSESKKKDFLIKQVIEVNKLENDCDIVYRKALATLFKDEKDPIEIIKWKHLFEQLENAMDSCENVANMIDGVIMKYA